MVRAQEHERNAYGAEELTCPFCGLETTDLDGECQRSIARTSEWECDGCEKTFRVNVDYTPTFYAWKPKADGDAGQA